MVAVLIKQLVLAFFNWLFWEIVQELNGGPTLQEWMIYHVSAELKWQLKGLFTLIAIRGLFWILGFSVVETPRTNLIKSIKGM